MAALLARVGSRQGYQTLRRYTPITQQICSIKTTNKKGETTQHPGLHPDYKKFAEEDRLAKDEVRCVVVFDHDNFFPKVKFS